jgi:translation initiation factor 5A
MTTEGATKDDVKLPEGELGEKIHADFDDGKELFVSITSAMNEEACLSYRTA